MEAEVATVEPDGSFRRPSSTLRLGSRSGSRGRLDELDFGAPQSPIATAQHRDGWEPRRSSASGDGSTALVTPAGSVSSRVLTGEEATLDGGADRRAAFPELLRTAPASSSAVPPLSLPAPLHETKQGAGNEETKGVEGQGSPDTARQVARAVADGVADPEAAALAIARGVPGTSSALVVAGKDVGGGARPVPSTSVPPPQLLPGFQEAERRRATELVSKGGMYDAAIPCTCVVSGGVLMRVLWWWWCCCWQVPGVCPSSHPRATASRVSQPARQPVRERRGTLLLTNSASPARVRVHAPGMCFARCLLIATTRHPPSQPATTCCAVAMRCATTASSCATWSQPSRTPCARGCSPSASWPSRSEVRTVARRQQVPRVGNGLT